MARMLVEKQVIFCGIWRPKYSHVDDSFIRVVSRECLEKPGARASWRLTADGLTVLVTQSESGRTGKTDQIPMAAIRDVTSNRFNPMCLMTFYLDQAKRFCALVCRCEAEQDAADLVNVFRAFQRSEVGEGFRANLKQSDSANWQLRAKDTTPSGQDASTDVNGHSDNPNHGVAVFVSAFNHELVDADGDEERLPREEVEVKGRPCCSVAVQAAVGPDNSSDSSDVESSASAMTLQSLRDELHSLSQEVRDIKDLLQRSAAISAEEYFRRTPDPKPGSQQFEAVHCQGPLHAEGHEGSGSEKKVNFAGIPSEGVAAGAEENLDLDFDIRSIGLQTDVAGAEGKGAGLSSRYAKRVRKLSERNRGKIPATFRPRSSSSTSSNPLSPTSPTSLLHSPGVFSNGGGTELAVSSGRRPHADTAARHDLRFRSASLSRGTVPPSTVVRPIESVYTAHASSVRNQRKMKPAGSTMPDTGPGSVVSASLKQSWRASDHSLYSSPAAHGRMASSLSTNQSKNGKL